MIGPGYGESIMVHLGDGEWLLIDSCKVSNEPLPAPLAYLRDIGADLSKVKAVVASHWDDDHAKGLAEVLEGCPSAQFVLSQALGGDEFLAYASAYKSPLTERVRAGVKEMRDALQACAASGRKLRNAVHSRRIFGPADLPLTHSQPIEVWTLSPSDEEFANFMAWVAEQMPVIKDTRRVSVKRKRNDLSVVVLISIGDDAMLFGGDLEEHGNPLTGWSAILQTEGRPNKRAGFFKIAHHGSPTGEHQGIWSTLLGPEPTAALAPWRLGKGSLPSEADVTRILGNTSLAFATTTLAGRNPRQRDRSVERTIRESTRFFAASPQRPGMLRFRKPAASGGGWSVEFFGDATLLSNIHN